MFQRSVMDMDTKLHQILHQILHPRIASPVMLLQSASGRFACAPEGGRIGNNAGLGQRHSVRLLLATYQRRPSRARCRCRHNGQVHQGHRRTYCLRHPLQLHGPLNPLLHREPAPRPSCVVSTVQCRADTLPRAQRYQHALGHPQLCNFYSARGGQVSAGLQRLARC